MPTKTTTKSAVAPKLTPLEAEILGEILHPDRPTERDSFARIAMTVIISDRIAERRYGKGTKAAAANRETLMRELYPQAFEKGAEDPEPGRPRCSKCHNLMRPVGEPQKSYSPLDGRDRLLQDCKCRSSKCPGSTARFYVREPRRVA